MKSQKSQKKQHKKQKMIPNTTHKDKRGTFCQICDRKLRSRYHLTIHLPVHTGEKNYICGICKKGYQQKWNLITHMARVHSKEKPFKCTDCGRAFGYSSHFKRHVKTHFLERIDASEAVKKIILNPHKCRVCDKSFESNYRLDLHSRTHTGARPYVCDKCGKSFTTKRLHAVHVQKKHEEDAFICEHCGETFSESGALFRHLKTGHNVDAASEAQFNEINDFNKQLTPCEVCGKTITRGAMKKHLNIHYRNRVYKCRYCDKEFLESGQRMVHERKHTGEKPYVCEVCNRGHTQYGNLLTHRKRYHNLTGKTPQLWKRNRVPPSVHNSSPSSEESSPLTTCVEPPRTPEPQQCTGNETLEEFLQKASTWVNEKFQEHKYQKQAGGEREKEDRQEVPEPDSPKTCEPSAEDKTLALKQMKKKTNKFIFDKIVEDLSGTSEREKVLRIVETLQKDSDVLREFLKKMKTVPDNVVMRTKDGILYWHCWLCESKLKSRHLLSRHLIIHEPEENRPYRCEDCYKTFTQSNNFKEHRMSHLNEKQYFCEICGGGFRHKTHFNTHMRRHEPTTTRSPAKKYECGYCDKKMYTKYQKTEHERTHTRERPFLCRICGQQFGASSSLRRHHSIHCNASHQCGICLKLFKQKYSLKRHYNTHFDHAERRVSCECGKTLSQSSSLKKHKMVCEKREGPLEKPFACCLCTKKFLTKSDLKRHAATHDSSKRFTCPVCFTCLKTDETFKRHMRRHDNVRGETESSAVRKGNMCE